MPANICCQHFKRSAAFLSLFQLIFRPVEFNGNIQPKKCRIRYLPSDVGDQSNTSLPFLLHLDTAADCL